MNALRDIDTAEEIQVKLQSNEVLVHVPVDTPLKIVPDKIHEAGYKSADLLCLLAEGRWTDEGFLPAGWSQALSGKAPENASDGAWQLCFEREDDTWIMTRSRNVERVPQVRDE